MNWNNARDGPKTREEDTCLRFVGSSLFYIPLVTFLFLKMNTGKGLNGVLVDIEDSGGRS
jgi:hypothetical protein